MIKCNWMKQRNVENVNVFLQYFSENMEATNNIAYTYLR